MHYFMGRCYKNFGRNNNAAENYCQISLHDGSFLGQPDAIDMHFLRGTVRSFMRSSLKFNILGTGLFFCPAEAREQNKDQIKVRTTKFGTDGGMCSILKLRHERSVFYFKTGRRSTRVKQSRSLSKVRTPRMPAPPAMMMSKSFAKGRLYVRIKVFSVHYKLL